MPLEDMKATLRKPALTHLRPEPSGPFGPTELIAVVLSVLWLIAAGAFFLIMPANPETGFDPFVFVMTLLAVFMPVALIWVGTSAAKSTRIMREESMRLQASIDAMRNAYIAGQQGSGGGVMPAGIERKLEEIAASQRQTEETLARLGAGGGLQAQKPALKVEPKPVQPDADDQPSLALGTPAEALENPISIGDFIRAVHFPESETDQEGFRALRTALRDPNVSPLVRSAQDVLTLLSEDGIYMDDLAPDRARPEIWRKFAKGERGRTVAVLGGVRDRSSLALAAGRMRQDPVFRDAAHHFLRKFDKTFVAFEQDASDSEIAALSETRTARAFMLLGRVAGTFD